MAYRDLLREMIVFYTVLFNHVAESTVHVILGVLHQEKKGFMDAPLPNKFISMVSALNRWVSHLSGSLMSI